MSREPRGLLGVGEESHLHERGRHGCAGQHDERRLADPPVLDALERIELLLDGPGEPGRVVEVGDVSQVPQDQLNGVRRGTGVFARGSLRRLRVARVGSHVVRLGAVRAPRQRCVRMDGDEHCRLKTIREGGPVGKRHGLVPVTGEPRRHARGL